MSSLGPHADFIVTAYAAAIVILIALIAWVWSDYQA
jgi:heme exporter protein CcmD